MSAEPAARDEPAMSAEPAATGSRAKSHGKPPPRPALELIRHLAQEIGPRRSCSAEEAQAAHALVAWLNERGVAARLQKFRGYASFGYPYAALFASMLAAAVVQRRGRRSGDALAAATFGVLCLEGDLRVTPLSRLLSRKPTVNVVASIPAAGDERNRVCLCAHLDSTRSGLMFHPRIVRYLAWLLQIPAISSALIAAGPLLRRLRSARVINALACGGLTFGLAMLAERELGGVEVAGASDNASGCGVGGQLMAEHAALPLEHTRLDLLITGCEESGLLGAQAYMKAHQAEAMQTTFINFDTVGGDAPLTYILREGGILTRAASPRLVELTKEIAQRRPDLEILAAKRTAGLPTDATVALARGCEAITFLAQGRTIPHYHWPTDTVENIAPWTVDRALEVGRELLAELDRLAST